MADLTPGGGANRNHIRGVSTGSPIKLISPVHIFDISLPKQKGLVLHVAIITRDIYLIRDIYLKEFRWHVSVTVICLYIVTG